MKEISILQDKCISTEIKTYDFHIRWLSMVPLKSSKQKVFLIIPLLLFSGAGRGEGELLASRPV